MPETVASSEKIRGSSKVARGQLRFNNAGEVREDWLFGGPEISEQVLRTSADTR